MFDGVHLGHQEVLTCTRAWADSVDAPALVMTFDIHPRQLLSTAPAMITSLEHRLLLFEQARMDAALILPFNDRLASLSAEQFVREILVDQLACRQVVLGFDARFGCDRQGDAAFLRSIGEDLQIQVREVEASQLNGSVISSTAIREAVAGGDLKTASAMLSRPVSVLGTVVHGLGLGRQLGFPTLNLDPHHELHPPQGVYFSRTRCGDTTWNSITNVGHRPTEHARCPEDLLIESHLLDYQGDLYGQTVEVFFLEQLRGEMRFDSHDTLARQVHKDITSAKAFFENRGDL